MRYNCLAARWSALEADKTDTETQGADIGGGEEK
jgi:hypothetical protein